jgi:large subunit ribosomal protein L22
MGNLFNVRLKGCRVAPRKARLVTSLVVGKPVQEALDILKFTNKRAAPIVAKLISSAINNATRTSTVDVDHLFISEAFCDPGPTWKRFLPRAQGRATPIKKRTCHITVKLKEI